MKREYGLIGFPLTHSFSEKYFTSKFEKENIADGVFYSFSIPEIQALSKLLHDHPLLLGFAITIPYKRAVLHYLNSTTEPVQEMQACNCVKISGTQLHGFNTDITGFEKSFLQHLKPYHKKALVLGTGGGASAVEYVLKKLQIDYRLVSRKKNTENKILGYEEINEEILQHYTIIINCTPVGTFPHIDEAPDLPYHFLTSRHYLFDLVYNPAITRFLSFGKKHNATIENGYNMLVYQAEENWKIWNS